MKRLVVLSLLAAGCASLIGVGDLSVSPPCVADPDAGLVAYYAFEEQSGQATVDCTGHDNTATFVDGKSPGWSDAGWRGGAIALDGNGNGCMQLPGSVVPNPPFTVSAFVFPLANSSVGFVVARQRGSPNDKGWHLSMNANATQPELTIFFPDGGVNGYSVSADAGNLQAKWHLLVASYDQDAGTSITVDGVTTSRADSPPPVTVDNGTTIRIGCRGDDAYAFVGLIDEVRIYDHVLSSGEIATLSQK